MNSVTLSILMIMQQDFLSASPTYQIIYELHILSFLTYDCAFCFSCVQCDSCLTTFSKEAEKTALLTVSAFFHFFRKAHVWKHINKVSINGGMLYCYYESTLWGGKCGGCTLTVFRRQHPGVRRWEDKAGVQLFLANWAFHRRLCLS